MTNHEEKSTSHASVFHNKAGERSSVSMPMYTQVCNVTYQDTYSWYQRRNILTVARLRTWKLGKPELTLFIQELVLHHAHLSSLSLLLQLLFPCTANFRPSNSLSISSLQSWALAQSSQFPLLRSAFLPQLLPPGFLTTALTFSRSHPQRHPQALGLKPESLQHQTLFQQLHFFPLNTGSP